MEFVKRNVLIIVTVVVILGIAIFLVIASNKTKSGDDDFQANPTSTSDESGATPEPTKSYYSPTELPIEGHGVRPDYDPEKLGKPVSTVGPSYAPDSGSTEKQAPTSLGDWKVDVTKFVNAYMDKTGDKEAWIAGMKPYASNSLTKLMSTINMENVETDKLESLRLRQDNKVGTVAFDVIGSTGGYLWSGTAQNAGGEKWVVTTLDGKL